MGGYVKGSSAGRQLEEAFEAVPRTSALELFNELRKGERPPGRLFQHRLSNVTKTAMLKILWRKHLEQKQQLREAQKKVEQACEAKKGLEKARAALKSSDSEVEGLCKVSERIPTNVKRLDSSFSTPK